MNRLFGILLLAATLCALALRAPELGVRPMHNDEAVNASKLEELWQKGQYRYDPDEYHGPALHYASLPALWLSGARRIEDVSESTLRAAPVAFGVGLVLLLWLLADGLGRTGALCAGVFTAVSPAMVFYSRYFIHEMLLVFFTLLLIAAGWRYLRGAHAGWALLAGAAAGLMAATKETFVLSLAALAGAALLTGAWAWWRDRPAPGGASPRLAVLGARLAALWNWKHAALAALAMVAVTVVFFTSFFTHAAGPLDALRTYLPWLHRAGGDSPHIYPWHFYFERLLWFHHGRGPVWSEAFILVLAAAGFLFSLRPAKDPVGGIQLVRFLGFYAALLTGLYCVIPYKTPWCALGFWHAVILLAGAGAAAVLGWQACRGVQALLGGLLALGTLHLGWQAWQLSCLLPAERKNPYAFAQTSADVLELVDKVKALSRADPLGDGLLIKVAAHDRDYWPLPWYFRQFRQVGWWAALPEDPAAPILIVDARLDKGLSEKIETTHEMTGIYSLRPQARVFLELFVEKSLWRRFMTAKEKTASQ